MNWGFYPDCSEYFSKESQIFLTDKFNPDNQPNADVHDSSVALNILAYTHAFLPITECIFLADKGYDVKNIYNQVYTFYMGECIIPLNKRNTKNLKLLPQGNPVCEAGLAMWKDSKYFKSNYPLRTECERYNSRFKNTGQERM